MDKLKEIRIIERYGFPDGDYPVFEETNGKVVKEFIPNAVLHETLGTDFLKSMGAKNRKDYLKLKGRKVSIEYDDDENGEITTISMKGIDGEIHTFGIYSRDENEEDWDFKYATALGKSL